MDFPGFQTACMLRFPNFPWWMLEFTKWVRRRLRNQFKFWHVVALTKFWIEPHNNQKRLILSQVLDPRNNEFVASYLATFLGPTSLPRKVEVEDPCYQWFWITLSGLVVSVFFLDLVFSASTFLALAGSSVRIVGEAEAESLPLPLWTWGALMNFWELWASESTGCFKYNIWWYSMAYTFIVQKQNSDTATFHVADL